MSPQEVWAGQVFCLVGAWGTEKKIRACLASSMKRCHCALCRARRCTREDPKIGMLCVIPISISVHGKSSEIGDTFQEQEKNIWLHELAPQL